MKFWNNFLIIQFLNSSTGKVEIWGVENDGEAKLHEFCGTDLPQEIISPGDYLDIYLEASTNPNCDGADSVFGTASPIDDSTGLPIEVSSFGPTGPCLGDYKGFSANYTCKSGPTTPIQTTPVVTTPAPTTPTTAPPVTTPPTTTPTTTPPVTTPATTSPKTTPEGKIYLQPALGMANYHEA